MFEPRTLDEAYALSKLQELTITGVLWCDRKKQYENEVDYSTKEWKLDSEMDIDLKIGVENEPVADTDAVCEQQLSELQTDVAEGELNLVKEGTESLNDHHEGELGKEEVHVAALGGVEIFMPMGKPTEVKKGRELEQDTLKGTECISYARQNAQVNELYYSLSLPWLLNWFPRPTVKMKFGLRFGVDARAVERLDHGKETELLANARRNAPSRELTAVLSVITNLKRFSVRFPKPMVKMKLELFSLWELLREADMFGVSRRKVVAHAWSLEQGLLVIELRTLTSQCWSLITLILLQSQITCSLSSIGAAAGVGIAMQHGLKWCCCWSRHCYAAWLGAYPSLKSLKYVTRWWSVQYIDLKWKRWWWRISVKLLLYDSLWTRNLKGKGLLRSQIVEGKSSAEEYRRVIRDIYMHAIVGAVGASMDRRS